MTNIVHRAVDLDKLTTDTARIAEQERKLALFKEDYAVRCIDALRQGQLQLDVHQQLVDQLVFELTKEDSPLHKAAQEYIKEVAQGLIGFYTKGEIKPHEIYYGFILKSPLEAYSLMINPNGEIKLNRLKAS